MTNVELTPEQVAEVLAKPYGLTVKEKRLLAYLLDDSKSRNIGDMRKALHTTTFTMLGKTQPSLEKKIQTMLGVRIAPPTRAK